MAVQNMSYTGFLMTLPKGRHASLAQVSSGALRMSGNPCDSKCGPRTASCMPRAFPLFLAHAQNNFRSQGLYKGACPSGSTCITRETRVKTVAIGEVGVAQDSVT